MLSRLLLEQYLLWCYCHTILLFFRLPQEFFAVFCSVLLNFSDAERTNLVSKNYILTIEAYFQEDNCLLSNPADHEIQENDEVGDNILFKMEKYLF